VRIAASNQFINLTFGLINTRPPHAPISTSHLVNYSGWASNSTPQTNGNNQITIISPPPNHLTPTNLSPWPPNEFYRVQISSP
jgi:hypothetical protein